MTVATVVAQFIDSCARLCFGLSAMRDEPMSNGDFTSALVF